MLIIKRAVTAQWARGILPAGDACCPLRADNSAPIYRARLCRASHCAIYKHDRGKLPVRSKDERSSPIVSRNPNPLTNGGCEIASRRVCLAAPSGASGPEGFRTRGIHLSYRASGTNAIVVGRDRRVKHPLTPSRRVRVPHFSPRCCRPSRISQRAYAHPPRTICHLFNLAWAFQLHTAAPGKEREPSGLELHRMRAPLRAKHRGNSRMGYCATTQETTE